MHSYSHATDQEQNHPGARLVDAVSVVDETLRSPDGNRLDVAEGDMRTYANDSPRVRQLKAYQEIADSSSRSPIQRVVKQSTARWGLTQGKWITTLAENKGFDTQEQAQAEENRILAEQQDADEAAWNAAAEAKSWYFADAQKRLTKHYNDGWGALYGITSHDDIKPYIEQNADVEQDGENTIDLGTHFLKKENADRKCTIVYSVELITLTVGPITDTLYRRTVFHCGPSS